MRSLTKHLAVWAAALAWAAPIAARAAVKPAGVVLLVSGQVSRYPAAASPTSRPARPVPIRRGQTVFAGDRLKTGRNGRLALVLVDGTQLKLNYDTDITLKDRDVRGKPSPRGVAAIRVFFGQLWARVTHQGSTLEFETPAAVAAVKGTEPLFDVAKNGTVCVRLRNGKLDLSNELSDGVFLKAGEQICMRPHFKITPKLVQAWDPNSTTWEKGFQQATRAAVTVKYVDASGAPRTLVLDYAAGTSGTAQGSWDLSQVKGGGATPTPGPGNPTKEKGGPNPTGTPVGWNLTTSKAN